MLAFLKHFIAYSRETDHGHDSYNISKHDLFETYLAQYKIAFSQGDASAAGVMCSYPAENGHPSCANHYLLNDILRGLWGRTDAVAVTDCGAVSNLREYPVSAPDDATAAAMALNNGTDIELGSTLFVTSLRQAVERNLTSAAIVKAVARRALLSHFRAGRFDPLDNNFSYSRLGGESMNTTLHEAVSLDAALQSLVLLKNDGGMLPLKLGVKLAVPEPMASALEGLLPNYAGNDRDANTCMTAGVPTYDCMTTIADALAFVNTGGETSRAPGVAVNDANSSGIAAALDLARAADFIVLALGIDRTIEYEGVDRVDTALPGLQESFAQQVLALGKPTVLSSSWLSTTCCMDQRPLWRPSAQP
ncbi:unnamed protein product [Polarella glacialis]|uniref:Beta-glucosidase n=1 Tax=Polarella glacialis TaxID=89957 RepID=A0A813K1Z0_POLGL|nr:unnamed protein product [Polarella glacialis]CAE8733679.1 unnamed protein product [Polarella glacialis]